MDVIRAMDDGSERILAIRKAGEFVGEGMLFNRGGVRTADVRAAARTRLLEIRLRDFDTMLKTNAVLCYEIVRTVSRRLSDADGATIRDLESKNAELQRAYEELQTAQAIVIEKERMDKELTVAQDIQTSNLPRELPSLPMGTLGAIMRPARLVGGDFYDAFMLNDETCGLVIGDVSGKGIPAAMLTSMARSLIRVEAMRGESPVTVLKKVNRHLLDLNDSSRFITVLFGVLHLRSREFDYARAGHEVPLWCSREGRQMDVPSGRGLVLGMYPHPPIDRQTLDLRGGDTLLLYTDGATDALDANGQFYGHERLRAGVKEHTGLSGQMLCDRMLADIQRFHQSQPQADDITLLSLVLN